MIDGFFRAQMGSAGKRGTFKVNMCSYLYSRKDQVLDTQIIKGDTTQRRSWSIRMDGFCHRWQLVHVEHLIYVPEETRPEERKHMKSRTLLPRLCSRPKEINEA